MLQVGGVPRANLVRNAGGLAALFSLAIVLLIMFALPAACSVVFSFQLVIFAFIFLVGLLAFLGAQTLLWFKRR